MLDSLGQRSFPAMLVLLLLLASFDHVLSQDILNSNHNLVGGGHHKFECGCMEYWNCVTRYADESTTNLLHLSEGRQKKAQICCSGGAPYSYCGIGDSDVCCFVPRNAEPVGILPTPTRSRCGKKGFDSGQEGEADMAEWPWHVSMRTYNMSPMDRRA